MERKRRVYFHLKLLMLLGRPLQLTEEQKGLIEGAFICSLLNILCNSFISLYWIHEPEKWL